MTHQTVAFVYKWIHIPSKMWYIGSRTKTNCHPSDGYIGKPQSAEHKKKRSEAMSGKQQSEEHKAKRAAALRLYHAQKKINNTDTGVFR